MRGIFDDRQIAGPGYGINSILERRQRLDRKTGLYEGTKVIDVQADGDCHVAFHQIFGERSFFAHDDKFLLEELF